MLTVMTTWIDAITEKGNTSMHLSSMHWQMDYDSTHYNKYTLYTECGVPDFCNDLAFSLPNIGKHP